MSKELRNDSTGSTYCVEKGACIADCGVGAAVPLAATLARDPIHGICDCALARRVKRALILLLLGGHCAVLVLEYSSRHKTYHFVETPLLLDVIDYWSTS